MCRTKMAVSATDPTTNSRTPRTPRTQPTISSPRTPRKTFNKNTDASSSSSSSNFYPSASNSAAAISTSNASYKLSSDTSIASRTSLSSLRDTLPENPHIYDFSEICAVTNNFLSKIYSSSSSSSTHCWRCNLRGKDVIIFQRKFRRKIDKTQLKEKLSVLCRSHHNSIIKLRGASVSGDHIYLVYDFVVGANLSDCLRNSKNPGFTVLSNWVSRMQIATDLAHGLDYIHNKIGLDQSYVHNHIKSSSVIITEPSFNARICHFGTAQLCGEIETENKTTHDSKQLSSSKVQFEGVRGYMSPDFQSTGVGTQNSDLYAFGVVILELISGEEPLRYRFDKKTGDFERSSIVETARAAVEGDGDSVEWRLRKWVDRRLNDSFPVEVAKKLTRLALECVHVDPAERPNMARVAGKISKLYLESKIWSDNVKLPTAISVSLAAR